MIMNVKISQLMTTSGVGFGTSGARGTVEAMTNEVCYAYTRGFLQALEQENLIQPGASIYLAGDLRSSTGRILAAVFRSIQDAGYVALYAGRLPSPAVAYYAMQQAAASIMVTGSHIPDDRNGIKFNRPDGEILKEDEERIRNQEVRMPDPFPAIHENDLPIPISVVENDYIARYVNFFPENCLAGMQVGVYEHSGVARDLLGKILECLGADVISLGRSNTFMPVDTEAIRSEDIRLGKEWAGKYPLNAIVSTDGDADRPLIADARGEWMRGDIVGILCARYLGIRQIVTPVSSNTAVEACQWFDRVYRTRIGSPYVISQMMQIMSDDVAVAGYEANGGFLLATDINKEGRILRALPTRDAVLPILAVLVSSREQDKTIRELVAELPDRYTASDRLKNFPSEISSLRIKELTEKETMVEQLFGDLCGKLAETDTTDGLRLTFENGEIIHLRPSGNAPELRCYNEASTPDRAEELNRQCLAKIGNWNVSNT